MKRFLKKLSIFVIVYVVLAGLLFFIIPPQYTTTYNAAILDKMDRLYNTASPKIILVGNSNLSFGMDSEKLEKAMGMPVVNLGLHTGLGNMFHEIMASKNIGEGDLVIVCHTSYSDNGKMYSQPEFWYTMENHYEIWNIPGVGGLVENLFDLPKYLIKAGSLYVKGTGNNPNLSDTNVFARSNFNKYGDIKPDAHKESDSVQVPGMAVLPEINDTCVNRLNKFNEYCSDRGAVMLVAGYPIPDISDRPKNSEYIAFQNELVSRLDCRVISDFTDYIYSPEYFNTFPNHLTDKGAELRTRQLITDLKAWNNN